MEPTVIPAYDIAADGLSFTAGGITYTAIEPDQLSIARYKVYQKREVEFGFNGTFSSICKELDTAWAALEKGQMGTAAKTLGNLRDGISFAGHSRIVGLEVCGLFFNSDTENPAVYDHPAMLAKLQAWQAAGVPVGFFFRQASRYVSGFYERFTQSKSEATEQEKSPPTP